MLLFLSIWCIFSTVVAIFLLMALMGSVDEHKKMSTLISRLDAENVSHASLIASQQKFIEEKMTEKVKEAFEKPKRPRGRPRKNV